MRGGGGVIIIEDIYRDVITMDKTSAILFTPGVATTGVKQGDPLSGILFIIAIDFLLRKIQNEGTGRDTSTRNLFHYIMAYANDVIIMAQDIGTLQALLHIINNPASKIGLF